MRWRSKAYLNWIRLLPCAHCGRSGDVEAHHIKGVGGLSGAGLRASDYLAMPLCPDCHAGLHNAQLPRAEQWQWLAKTQAAFFESMARGLGPKSTRLLIEGLAGDYTPEMGGQI